MRYALVPRHYVAGEGGAADHVVLWVGALSDDVAMTRPQPAVVRAGEASAEVTWRYAFGERVYADEVTLPVAFGRGEVALELDGRVVATAVVGAPPRELPGPGERPYTVLIGSCYGVHRDVGRRLARAAEALVAGGAAPDVKFLCGDQVYLDVPTDYAETEHPREELEEKFLGKYLATWSDAGLLPLLRLGATWLTSDDHEFWNEYPAMRGVRGRTAAWESIARDLFTLFQRREEPAPFSAGAVSFFSLDTRLDRAEAFEDFCPPTRLDAVQRWLDGLSGVGVLVLGETFFGEENTLRMSLSRKLGELAHRPTIYGTLQEYRQYHALAAMLARSGKTVVLLAGDVHWGRISECKLPNGTRLVEVVSSPLTLSDWGFSKAGRPWTPSPTPFEAAGLRGDVVTHRGPDGEPYQPGHDHFCTLEFSRADAGVRMRVRHWRVDDAPPAGEVVFEVVL
ncbi:MAG: hypothetical protein U0324_07855 [Polyangiales bacterium]